MRKLFFLFICVFLFLALLACTEKEKGGNESESAVTSASTTAYVTTTKAPVTTAVNIGNPLNSHYKSAAYPRNPWDMILFDGRLYVGGGDYSANSEAMAFYAYDIESGEWLCTGHTSDHAISKFKVIDGDLYAPGIDSLEDWSTGNYYMLKKGGEWQTFSDVPGGVHVYDIAKTKSGLLIGIGTGASTFTPALYKDSLTGRYTELPLIRDGKSVLASEEYGYTRLRIYDFFNVGDEVYAFCAATATSGRTEYAIYKYEGERFLFVSTLANAGISTFSLNGRRLWQNFFGTSVYAYGNCYVTSGKLFKTRDFKSSQHISAPDDRIISDLLCRGGIVYVLGFSNTRSDIYENVVWSLDENDSFSEILRFETKGGYALSFECDTDSFYFGIGSTDGTWATGYVRQVYVD